ncbi:MAG: branched-chain amino acid ABC transporter permease [Chloroflexota bacterium]
MDVAGFVQFALNALSLGSLYALMALGMVVVYGVLRLVNLAYGELLMVAGYTLLVLGDGPFPWLIAAVLAVIAASVASLLTERIAFRPVRSNSLSAMIITSFAVSTLLQNGALLLVSPRARAVRIPEILTQNVTVAGISIGVANVLTLVVSIAVLASLSLVLRRTTLGLALRAAADDFVMTRLLGVRADRVIATAFAISGLLAGVVGLFWIARIGSVTPVIGAGPLLIALIAIVIGGMETMTGALVGGYLLGVLTVGMQLMLPQGLLDFRDAFTFAIVILILLVRPEGIVSGRATSRRIA